MLDAAPLRTVRARSASDCELCVYIYGLNYNISDACWTRRHCELSEREARVTVSCVYLSTHKQTYLHLSTHKQNLQRSVVFYPLL